MEELNNLPQAVSLLGLSGFVGWFAGWAVLNTLKKRMADVEKIPSFEARIIALELQVVQYTKTTEAVVRMEEQIKHLSEQVNRLSDLLMRKVFNEHG